MGYYRICPHCGAHLDPGGEVCDCRRSLEEQTYNHHLRKHDKAGYIALLCAMACGSPTAPMTELEGVSRGTFKRAIRCLRAVQKDYLDPAAIDHVIAYIRRERLHRGEGAA